MTSTNPVQLGLPHRVDAPPAAIPRKGVRTSIREAESGSRHQIDNRSSDEHLSPPRQAGHLAADVNHEPAWYAANHVALSGVQAEAGGQAGAPCLSSERGGASDPTGRTIEDDENLPVGETHVASAKRRCVRHSQTIEPLDERPRGVALPAHVHLAAQKGHQDAIGVSCVLRRNVSIWSSSE